MRFGRPFFRDGLPPGKTWARGKIPARRPGQPSGVQVVCGFLRFITRRFCGLLSADCYICGKMNRICTFIRLRNGRTLCGTGR